MQVTQCLHNYTIAKYEHITDSYSSFKDFKLLLRTHFWLVINISENIHFRLANATSCAIIGTARVVWLARPSLNTQSRKARKGRDGLAYIAISSHLAVWHPANEMLGFGCYEYYCQEIVAIVFIVLGEMAVASDSISEESPRYPVKLGTKGHHFYRSTLT